MKEFRLIIAAGLLLAAPAFAAKPQIQWDQSYDFSSVETFAWQPSQGQTLADNEPFLHEHIINAIEFHLTDSGLTETDTNPDVIVTYYGSTETQVRLQSDSYGYGWGGAYGPAWGYYGYGRAGPVSTTTRVVEHETGTLVVDVVDAATSQLIWRGTASGIAVTDNIEKMKKAITKALLKMVKQSRKLGVGAADG